MCMVGMTTIKEKRQMVLFPVVDRDGSELCSISCYSLSRRCRQCSLVVVLCPGCVDVVHGCTDTDSSYMRWLIWNRILA